MHQRYAGEIAKAPHDKSVYLIRRGIVIQDRDQGRGQVTDHDTDDQQHDIALHLCRKPDDQSQDTGGTGKGCDNNRQVAADGQLRHHTERPAEIEHDGRDSQVCPVADPQDGRACQRVTEQSLQ